MAATRVDPIPGGGSLAEVRIVQPWVMLDARALRDRLHFRGTLNFEGLTIPDGVLGVGSWGEGFNDRRHPHTYAHEIVLTANDLLGALDRAANVSVTVGKGFVPFGSDDPMSRPPIAYPINHHWAQLLERAVAAVGVRAGPLLLEGALFNGDEPERPTQWPRVAARFGDSWSARVTVYPRPWIEVSGSRAAVKSPEHRGGAATVQHKWHVSGRAERDLGYGTVYGLVEWARNTEADGFFGFTSQLAEAAWTSGRFAGYYRFERTERPEEERLLDLFRSARPHLEATILGTTRWSVHTAGARLPLRFIPGTVHVEVLAEGSYARIANATAGLFDPLGFYRSNSMWSLSVGLRVSTGARHRMGRYGAAGGAGHAH